MSQTYGGNVRASILFSTRPVFMGLHLELLCFPEQRSLSSIIGMGHLHLGLLKFEGFKYQDFLASVLNWLTLACNRQPAFLCICCVCMCAHIYVQCTCRGQRTKSGSQFSLSIT